VLLLAAVAKGVGEVGDGPGTCVNRGLASLMSVCVYIGIAFSPYIVPEVCLMYVYQRPATMKKELIKFLIKACGQ
jgi:hypothetical protein